MRQFAHDLSQIFRVLLQKDFALAPLPVQWFAQIHRANIE